MYYEINISRNGAHFFATAERSITDGVKLLKIYNALRAKFISADGYELTVTKWEKIGHGVDMDALINGTTKPHNTSVLD